MLSFLAHRFATLPANVPDAKAHQQIDNLGASGKIPSIAGIITRTNKIMDRKPDDGYWRLRPDVVCTVLNDGAVVLDLRSKFFYSANSTAWAMLQMFENGTSRAHVRAAGHRWGANGDVQTVEAVLDLIFAEDLVEPVESPSAMPADVAVSVWVPPLLTKNREPLQRIMVSAFDPGLPLAE